MGRGSGDKPPTDPALFVLWQQRRAAAATRGEGSSRGMKRAMELLHQVESDRREVLAIAKQARNSNTGEQCDGIKDLVKDRDDNSGCRLSTGADLEDHVRALIRISAMPRELRAAAVAALPTAARPANSATAYFVKVRDDNSGRRLSAGAD